MLGPGIETVLLRCNEYFLTTRGFFKNPVFLLITLFSWVISSNCKVLRSLIFMYYHIVWSKQKKNFGFDYKCMEGLLHWVWTYVRMCLFNAFSPHCCCQIHIDIPRMTPESLVLQPKVTEVRWTEQTGLWTRDAPRSRQQKSCTLTGGLISAGSAPAAVVHPSGLPSDESACLSRLLICGADTLKWCHRGPTNTLHTLWGSQTCWCV